MPDLAPGTDRRLSRRWWKYDGVRSEGAAMDQNPARQLSVRDGLPVADRLQMVRYRTQIPNAYASPICTLALGSVPVASSNEVGKASSQANQTRVSRFRCARS